MTELSDRTYPPMRSAGNPASDWKAFFRECGRRGGKVKSPRKAAAARRNGRRAKTRRHKNGK